eukprot:6031069-Prymnesium_polylepis.2
MRPPATHLARACRPTLWRSVARRLHAARTQTVLTKQIALECCHQAVLSATSTAASEAIGTPLRFPADRYCSPGPGDISYGPSVSPFGDSRPRFPSQ